MKLPVLCGWWLALLSISVGHAAPITIANPSFEVQSPELQPDEFTNFLVSWLETGGPGAVAGFVAFIPGFAAEGTDHLGMEVGHDVWQDVGVSYTPNTVYTLTVSVGNRLTGSNSIYALTTGTVRPFAIAGTDASALVPVGGFADAAALTLDTVEEPGAVGRSVRVLLQARGNGRSHFDNIRLDATATAQNGRPIGNSSAATLVTITGSTVGGSVTSIGSAAPSVAVYYGPTDAGSNPADWALNKVLAGTFTGAFSTPLTDLTSNTRYFFRARFTNASGSTWGATTRSFDTLTLPTLVNLPATNFAPTSATVGARVTIFSGLPPAVTVYYGTTDGGTTAGNWTQSRPLGAVSATASGNLSGLLPATTYFYRAFATNAAGSSWAPASASFTTTSVSPPSIVNREASDVKLTSATLRADVTSTGLSAPTVTFYYGTVDGGMVPGAWANAITAGVGAGKVAAPVSGLTAGTLYYFRSAATNSAGTAWSPVSTSFTTEIVIPPSVRTLAATHVRSTMATLSGEVTSSGNETPSVILYWGTVDGGTSAASWANAVPLGTSGGTFFRVLTGLAPGVVYHFRAYASNSAGGTWATSGQVFGTLPTEGPPAIVINEIHYDPLDPTKFQEFIELHNPGPVAVNLTGWRLASGVDYTFGNVSIPSGGFFCIVQDPAKFATSWPAAAPLSAGPWIGRLKNSGETIELRDAAGLVVTAVDYGEGFPWPTAPRGGGPSMELLHPSLDPSLGASWRRSPAVPTPAAVNASKLATAAAAPPAIRKVSHAPEQSLSNLPVTVTATVTDPDGVGSVALRYQIVAPGTYIRKADAAFNAATSWITLEMLDNGTAGDAVAGDSIFTALIPASVQVHRRLIRYQITVTDSLANSIRVPYADDEQPNFAYFVYDALPAWSGALRPTAFNAFAATPVQDFPQSLLQSIEPWHLIANEANIISCQYDSGFNGATFTGTLVHRRRVYDHITYQVRGIGSTYQSGKNKWALKFNRARDFQAYDNWGQPYAETWNSLGLNACASPWASVNRGAAGIDEAAPFRAYELAGLPALRTNYVHWRVIRRPAEVNPAASIITGDPMGASIRGQYSGDLWGLYLALEPTEGNLLDERGLGDGNIYSIEGNGGDKKHQADTQPPGTTDWNSFSAGLAQTSQTEAWYRANMDLPALYSFLALNRLVGNTDVRPGDNYRYYHRPGDNRWVIMPYDLDMMFIAAHHWGGSMDNGTVVAGAPNAIRAISRHPAIALEYRNRCRELLSLLASDSSATGGQIGQLIQEYAAMVNPPGVALTWSDLDAAMWNLHPRTAGGGENTGQSSHKGNFFRTRYLDGGRGGLGGTSSTGSWIRDLALTGSHSDHENLAQWFTNFATNTYPANAAAWVRKATNASGGGADSDVNRQKGYGYKYLEWESLYGGFVDANNNPAANLPDLACPYTPVIFASGGADFPVNDLRFTTTDFNDPQGSATAAAVQWRLGEISAPGLPGYNSAAPSIYEISPVWTSAEIPLATAAIAEVRVPAATVVPGHTYRARVRHKDTTGRWSSWSSPIQFIASGFTTAGYQQALRITEINYDPAAVTAAELAHPSWVSAWTAQQFEYVELTNISAESIDLTDVRFTKGIDYNFPPGTQLAAGARIIVAKNAVALAIRYGSGLTVAPGSYDPDSLGNGGEQLKLSYGAGITIFDFIYDNNSPWPVSPNGGGPSLILITPEKLNLDHGDAMEWRASVMMGSPGTGDRISYAGWAASYPDLGGLEQDDDGDGITNFMEFSLGSVPTLRSAVDLPSATLVGDRFQFSVTYAPANGGHTRHVEFSTALGTWAQNGTLIGRVTLLDGRFTDTWQSPLLMAPGSPRQFARLRLTTP